MHKLIKLSAIAVTLMVVSCATTKPAKIEPYPQITMDNIKQNCQPAEYWKVPVLGLQSYVYKFENCLNFEALLSVSVSSEELTEEIRQNTVNLLAGHYMQYLQRTEEPVNGTKRVFSIKKAKDEIAEAWKTHFFIITYKKVKCAEGACEENKI